ncbi:MAG: hypothetical protein P8P15_08330 [Polaribacter sp.]|nr:hypothetical protein [Polaribacter sp.]MDG1227969.1 hypothetical protein [Polaribacter sp.]
MKNLKQILVAIFVLTLISACEKDENDPKNEILEKATISAKWTVNNSSDYESFEFNESGNYIVVKKPSTKSTNDQVVFFGTYEITDDKTIVLSNFGTLTITEIDENSISFSILLVSNPDSQVSIKASKAEELESSTNTDLLCQSWELVSFGGETMSDFYVLFSSAGTYLVNAEVDGEEITGLGTWTWCNTDENKLAFTIDNTLDCDGIEIIKDIKLTSESFSGIDMENGEPMEMIMQPASSTKSARLKSQKNGVMIFGIEK